MKNKIKAIVLLALPLCGCSTTNISELVKAAAQDPAKVHLEVRSVYGIVTYDRQFPDGWRTNAPAQ